MTYWLIKLGCFLAITIVLGVVIWHILKLATGK